jgi:hypothetical protein
MRPFRYRPYTTGLCATDLPGGRIESFVIPTVPCGIEFTPPPSGPLFQTVASMTLLASGSESALLPTHVPTRVPLATRCATAVCEGTNRARTGLDHAAAPGQRLDVAGVTTVPAARAGACGS